MRPPKVVAWNCGNAGSAVAVRHLLFLIHCKKLDILILVEIRVHSNFITIFLAKTEFNQFFAAEASGFSGGIWILWNSHKLQIELASIDGQVINAVIWEPNKTMAPSVVYASPNPAVRQLLWERLPWLVVGDFNKVI